MRDDGWHGTELDTWAKGVWDFFGDICVFDATGYRPPMHACANLVANSHHISIQYIQRAVIGGEVAMKCLRHSELNRACCVGLL